MGTNLAKIGVEGSNPFARSKFSYEIQAFLLMRLGALQFRVWLGAAQGATLVRVLADVGERLRTPDGALAYGVTRRPGLHSAEASASLKPTGGGGTSPRRRSTARCCSPATCWPASPDGAAGRCTAGCRRSIGTAGASGRRTRSSTPAVSRPRSPPAPRWPRRPRDPHASASCWFSASTRPGSSPCSAAPGFTTPPARGRGRPCSAG